MPATGETEDGRGRDEPTAVVGVGASAGGLQAVSRLVAGLPRDFAGAVLVVVHVSPGHRSALAAILARAGLLPASAPEGPTPLRRGHVYAAPPGQHLLVERGQVVLSSGPRENGHRPAVDPLLRALADAYGRRAVGVVLSGARDDGTAGLHYLKQCGGRAFAQDPAEALFDGMPTSAIAHVAVDAVLPVDEIARRLTAIARDPPESQDPNHRPMPEPRIAPDDEPTRFTCPDCGGVLYRHVDGDFEQFRCSIGHALSPQSLDGEHARSVEQALWTAARILDDRAALMDDMRGRAERHGQSRSARQFAERAADVKRHAEALRGLAETVTADAEPRESAVERAAG